MKYLIAGLGNIGDKYIHTRHNVGFLVAEAFAADAFFESARLAFHTEIKFKGRTAHIIKPTTFMNLSGKAVKYWMDQEKIALPNVLVITDDIALPFGKLRIKGKGTDGGHNGLKDIIQVLGTNEFPRLRFGVGGDFPKGKQVDHVLGEWTKDEKSELSEKISKAVEAVKSFMTIGLERTMNVYN